MFKTILILLTFIIIVYFSVKIKADKSHLGKRVDLPDETKSSPVSRALAELIAVAGGIYLSLVMLVSFLNLDVADSIIFFGYEFEPLAAISVIIAITQPWLVKLFQYYKK